MDLYNKNINNIYLKYKMQHILKMAKFITFN